MSAAEHLCVLRGGGDLATGVAWRLHRAGFPVVITELAEPLTVRRLVSLSTAVTTGTIDIEGMVGRLAADPDEARAIATGGEVGVIVSPGLPPLDASVVVDARMAKRNLDTSHHDAPLLIGLGPGFTAGDDCHAVIETLRGHRLGRVLWDGAAAPDTGVPGSIGGHDFDRVVRAPASGIIRWEHEIGDRVEAGSTLGQVDGADVMATISGVVRGLILDGTVVARDLKIGDIDPRADAAACREISDKALAIGGGVLEAVMTWLARNTNPIS